MPNTRRHKGSFNAKTPDGRTVQMQDFVEVVDAADMSNPHDTLEGLRHIVAPDGRSVNVLGKGRYQIVGDNDVLTSDDPRAP